MTGDLVRLTTRPALLTCRTVTTKPVTRAPPFDRGAFQRATAVARPPKAPEEAGAIAAAAGGRAGITWLDCAEKAPRPLAFTAWTLNRYLFPFASPVTRRLLAADDATRIDPTWAPVAFSTWTRYDVITDPPLPGAVQRTSAEAFRGAAAPIPGAPGSVDGVTRFDSPEKALVPARLLAATRNR